MAPVRTLAVALALACALVAQPGEDDAARRLLDDVSSRFRELVKHRDLRSVRRGELQLERLASLRFASAGVREAGCAFLRREVLDRRGRDDRLFRWRVQAVALIARLAEDRSWADYLATVARGDTRSSHRGLDLFVERAAGFLRSPAHVTWMLERISDPRIHMRKLALSGLMRLERTSHLPLLQTAEPRLIELSASRDVESAARAVSVLSRLDTRTAVDAILRATKARDAVVRVSAVRGLAGQLGVPTARKAVIALLEDRDPRVREAAVLVFASAGDKSPVPRLVERLSHEPLRIRSAIRQTLRQLTRVDFGTEPGPWQAWLTGGDTPAVSDPTPTCCGMPVPSDAVVFVLDVSGTMGSRAGSGIGVGTRLERAKNELSKTLQSLDARTRFAVVAFSSSTRHWSRRGLRTATPENVAAAVGWIRKRVPGGATNTHDAVRQVLDRYADADTAVLISDGAPSAGKRHVQEQVIRDVVTWNRRRQIRIHTVAIVQGGHAGFEGPDDPREAQRFIQALADETGGDFVVLR